MGSIDTNEARFSTIVDPGIFSNKEEADSKLEKQ
jgi:hypothetical protein